MDNRSAPPPPPAPGPPHWQSQYTDAAAQAAIRREAIYVGACLVGTAVATFVVWIAANIRYMPEFFRPLQMIDPPQYHIFARYAMAWLGGTLGSTLYVIRWLHRSVAHGDWGLDYRLWRYFTPHSGGAVGFVFVVLIASGTGKILDAAMAQSLSSCLGIGFLAGYFTDSAMKRLKKVVDALFGTEDTPTKPAANKTGGGALSGDEAVDDDTE